MLQLVVVWSPDQATRSTAGLLKPYHSDNMPVGDLRSNSWIGSGDPPTTGRQHSGRRPLVEFVDRVRRPAHNRVCKRTTLNPNLLSTATLPAGEPASWDGFVL